MFNKFLILVAAVAVGISSHPPKNGESILYGGDTATEDCNKHTDTYDEDGLGNCTGTGGCAANGRPDIGVLFGAKTNALMEYVDVCASHGCNSGNGWAQVLCPLSDEPEPCYPAWVTYVE